MYPCRVLCMHWIVRHKAHVGSLHGFADSSRIIGVVFRAKQIGFHILGVDAADFVPKTFDGSGPIIRGCARFHADKAGRQVGEKAYDPGPGQSTAEYRLAFIVNAVDGKAVLCQINADGGSALHGMVSSQGFYSNLCIARLYGRGHPISVCRRRVRLGKGVISTCRKYARRPGIKQGGAGRGNPFPARSQSDNEGRA